MASKVHLVETIAERTSNLRKKKKTLLLCGIKALLLNQNFKITLHTHVFIYTTKIPDLFITPLSTLLILNQTTRIHPYHSKLFNLPYKVVLVLSIIQDLPPDINQITILPKLVESKFKINFEHSPIQDDPLTNCTNNLELLLRLKLCLPRFILGAFLLITILRLFTLIILGVLVTQLSIDV